MEQTANMNARTAENTFPAISNGLPKIPKQAEAIAATNPYDALIAGNVTDIDLVVIGGIPTFGDPELLGNLNVKTEPVTVCGAARALNVNALPAGSFAEVEARLTAEMKAAGSRLAPLAECVP